MRTFIAFTLDSTHHQDRGHELGTCLCELSFIERSDFGTDAEFQTALAHPAFRDAATLVRRRHQVSKRIMMLPPISDSERGDFEWKPCASGVHQQRLGQRLEIAAISEGELVWKNLRLDDQSDSELTQAKLDGLPLTARHKRGQRSPIRAR